MAQSTETTPQEFLPDPGDWYTNTGDWISKVWSNPVDWNVLGFEFWSSHEYQV